jgi:uncharacterized membrane protein YccC
MLLTRHLRTQWRELARVAPVRPAIAAGLRGATAAVVPLLAGHFFGFTGAGFASLGGFAASIIDKGGAYRSRASAMMIMALVSAFVATTGSLFGMREPVIVPVMLILATACAFARVYGAAATSIGTMAAVIFNVALAAPLPTFAQALDRGANALAGALVAMLLSLALWPVRVYRPARDATALAYRAIADYAGAIALIGTEDAPSRRALFGELYVAAYNACESARATLAAIRRGRQGESGRGERLLLIVELSDPLFRAVAAFADVVENAVAHGATTNVEVIRDYAIRVAATCQALASVVELEERDARARFDELRETLARLVTAAESLRGDALLERLSAEARTQLELAVRTAMSLGDERLPVAHRQRRGRVRLSRMLVSPITDNFSRDSIVLRHALRVGISAAVAVALTSELGLKRGYWVTLAVIVILQPNTGETVLKGLQRVIGTILGCAIAAVLPALVHSSGAMIVVIFIFAVVSLSLLPVNYALYSLFLTPTFVLLAEVNAGDWHLVRLRITNTLIGAAIAFGGATLLWPRAERLQIRAEVEAALRALRNVARALADVTSPKRARRRQLSDTRRAAGLALTNAETALQRYITESGERQEVAESWMTLVVFMRRFALTIDAFAAADGDDVALVLVTFGRQAETILSEVADAVAGHRVSADDGSFEALRVLVSHGVPEEIVRLAEQLRVMGRAAGRIRGVAVT